MTIYTAMNLLISVSVTQAETGSIPGRATPAEIGQHAIGGATLPWQYLFLVFGVLLVLGSLYAMWRMTRQAQEENQPMLIYSSLARDVGLSLGDQYLLYRIARQQMLPSPITLLISRRTLSHHALSYASEQQLASQRRILARVRQINEKMFGKTENSTES